MGRTVGSRAGAHDCAAAVDSIGYAEVPKHRHHAILPEEAVGRTVSNGTGAHDRAAAVDSIGDGVCATEGPKVGDHAILPEEGAY